MNHAAVKERPAIVIVNASSDLQAVIRPRHGETFAGTP
jgi:hypothetical protein